MSYEPVDWMIWTAGTVSEFNTRNMLITRLRDYLANGKNNAPFSDWYLHSLLALYSIHANPP